MEEKGGERIDTIESNDQFIPSPRSLVTLLTLSVMLNMDGNESTRGSMKEFFQDCRLEL